MRGIQKAETTIGKVRPYFRTGFLCIFFLFVTGLSFWLITKAKADEPTFNGPINFPIVNTNQNLTLLIYDARAIYSTDPSYTAEQWFEETHYYGWRYDENNGVTSDLVVNGAILPWVDYVTFAYTHSYPIDYDEDGIPDDYYWEPLVLMPNETLNLPYYSDFTYPWGTTFSFVMFQIDAAWGGPPPCTNSTLTQMVTCGSVLFDGVLSATNIQVCSGGSLTPPSASGTVISNGLKQIVVSNCISGIISTSNFPITYSIGPVVFSPAMTGPFTSSQSYSAQLIATPSDTNCEPITVSLGSVSVEVVNTAATNVTVNCGSVLYDGTLAASNVWVCINGTVGPPGIQDAPVFTNGTIITAITPCNTLVTTFTTNDVTYTPGEIYFDPPFPTEFTNATNLTFTAYMDAESSDPRCPPLTAYLGTVNLFVVTNSYTNIVCAVPGSVATPGSLSMTNAQLCPGDPLTPPSVGGLTFSNGMLLTIVVDCAAGTTNIITNAVSYTASQPRFIPTLPSYFPNAGNFLFEAVIDAIPSNTNCPAFPITVGMLTVSVGDTTTNITVQCGSIASSGSLYPPSVQVCTNGIPGLPSFNSPTFSNGEITTTVYDCQSQSYNTTTTPITYSPGGVYFDPPLPSSFPNTGSWSFTAKVQATSSDSRCPTLTATLGTFTVNVVDTSSTNIICAAAGSLVNAGTISTTNVQVCAGLGAPNPPTGSGATFSDGILHTIVINCDNSNTNITASPVTYTAGSIYLDPPMPSSFEETGTQIFTVKVNGTPSHPACPVVTAVVGSFTVVVVNTLTNETVNCGSIASSGSLLTPKMQVCTNSTASVPNFIPPVFVNGEVIKEIIDCQSWETTMQTNAVTYSPGTIYFEPPLPAVFTAIGSQSFTAKITATPSDSRCSPLTATLGTFTVEVVDTASTNVVCAGSGGLTNATWLSSTNYQVCLYGNVTPPGLANAEFSKGYTHTIVVDCAAGTTNITTNEVSYTVGQLTFEPPIPESFYDANTYTFTAMVEGIPSDTNCPPILASLGTVTITAGYTTTNITYQCGAVTNQGSVNLTNIICAGGSASPPSVSSTFFVPGQIIEVTVDCENGITNNTVVGEITYSPQVRFNPTFPTNNFTTPGTYTFQILVDGISSTNACPNLTANAGSLTIIVSKVDIVQTNEYVCVNGQTIFSVTSDSVSPIYWSISPDNGTNGAHFPSGNSGQSVYINVGTNVTTYTITAYDQWTNCMDTATLTVQKLSLSLSVTNVFVNADDDNGNGTNDVNDALSGNGSEVTGENDLVLLTLQAENFTTNQTVTISYPANVRLWSSPTRGPDDPITNSTSWPANSMPTSLYIEGVAASMSMNDVQLTLSASPGCAASTNLTVIDVVSVSFQTNLSAILVNSNAGGGLAIFPDKPNLTSTGDFSSVKVVVIIQPALTNIALYLRSIDVDDPSSDHAPPLDDESRATDNKATSNPNGRLGGGGDTITLMTATNGIAQTNFFVTMQPGDNFRVIASPLSDFPNHCSALQTNHHGALVFGSTTNEIPSNYRTPMLTVWRRLHVEMDSMAAVPPYANSVSGGITSLLGDIMNGSTQAVINVNLVTDLTPNDISRNLSSSPQANGRFERGGMLIGVSPDSAVTLSLQGNGDDFLRTTNGANFNIPFAINQGGTSVVGQVFAMTDSYGGTIFGVTTALAPGFFDGGTIKVAGHEFTVDYNSTNTVRIVNSGASISFSSVDDDSNSVLPQSPLVGLEFQTLYRTAYIEAILDGGGNTNYNTLDVPFVLNITMSTIVESLTNGLQSASNRSTNFWCAYAQWAYQPSPGPEQIGTPGVGNPPRADADADNEVILPGVNMYGYGAMLFLETFRDRGALASSERLVAHEIAHQFGAADTYISGQSPADDIMGAGMYSSSARFYPEAMHSLRNRQNSPGSPGN